jgi:hypothetical protein
MATVEAKAHLVGAAPTITMLCHFLGIGFLAFWHNDGASQVVDNIISFIQGNTFWKLLRIAVAVILLIRALHPAPFRRYGIEGTEMPEELELLVRISIVVIVLIGLWRSK